MSILRLNKDTLIAPDFAPPFSLGYFFEIGFLKGEGSGFFLLDQTINR